MMKPYAESCDQNRQAILECIQPLYQKLTRVLEIGSGTGQHAVFFAAQMPHLLWQSSDVAAHHAGIQQWLDDAALSNLLAPLELDVSRSTWPAADFDGVFSANTVHIMHWPDVVALFAGVGKVLQAGGLFTLYGPFNYQRNYTSESNARFDQWLKARDPHSAIRDFDDLQQLASDAQLEFQQDYPMPANNRILCWRKRGRLG